MIVCKPPEGSGAETGSVFAVQGLRGPYPGCVRLPSPPPLTALTNVDFSQTDFTCSVRLLEGATTLFALDLTGRAALLESAGGRDPDRGSVADSTRR
jgi:hypothetical protein